MSLMVRTRSYSTRCRPVSLYAWPYFICCWGLMDLLIRNGRLVDPARKLDTVTDVLIRDGKVSKIGKADTADVPVFDASGLIVAPGFFDIHVHLREPGTEEAETIATGGHAAVAGGFTAVAAMPNTKPPNDSPAITFYIVSEA